MNLNDVSLPPATKAAMRNTIEAELRATRSRRSKRTLGVSVLAVSLVAAGATAGTAYFVSQQPAENLTRVTCYASTDLSKGPGVQVEKELSGPFANDDPDVDNPVEECRDFWKAGALSTTGRPFTGQPLGPGEPLPELQACVRGEFVAVIPGGPGTCGALKLPEWDGR